MALSKERLAETRDERALPLVSGIPMPEDFNEAVKCVGELVD